MKRMKLKWRILALVGAYALWRNRSKVGERIEDAADAMGAPRRVKRAIRRAF